MIVDAATLRVILIVLAGLLVLGVYIWEHLFQDDESQGETGWPDSYTRAMDGMVMPGLVGMSPRTQTDDREVEKAMHALSGLTGGNLVAKNSDTRKAQGAQARVETPIQAQELNPVAIEYDKDDYWHTGIQSLDLQLIIGAKGGEQFSGTDILRAAKVAGFKGDETAVFRHYGSSDDQETMLFSMANIAKPWVFPMQAMDEFKTPGLVLVTELTGARDGIELFSAMLASAKVIANELGGEVQDESRSRLTNQTKNEIFSRITAYQRKIRPVTRRGRA